MLNSTVFAKSGSLRGISKFLSYEKVNAKELSKFSSIGSEWWDRTSVSGTGPLHDMNPIRVEFIRKNVAKALDRTGLFETQQLKGLNILDVGCGGGLLSESLARLGANVTSIDPSPENIGVASAHSSHDPLTAKIVYKQSTIEQILESGQKFDVVCALEVIEHVDNPKDFIQACASCVEGSNGSLFVSTMNRTRKSHLMAVVGAEYVLGLLPPGTHEWDKFVTPDELTWMVESTPERNMKLKTSNGLVLKPNNPLKGPRALVEWALSDTDIDVNYISHFTRA